jgi:hypothetical protein
MNINGLICETNVLALAYQTGEFKQYSNGLCSNFIVISNLTSNISAYNQSTRYTTVKYLETLLLGRNFRK